jgi:hypothetical protein
MSKKGYGGFLGPIIRGIMNSMVREGLRAAGRRKSVQGAGRIKIPRRLVQGKDKRGHKKTD